MIEQMVVRGECEMKLLGNVSVCEIAHRNLMTVKGAAVCRNIGAAVNLVGFCLDPNSIGNLIKFGEKARLVFMPPEETKNDISP